MNIFGIIKELYTGKDNLIAHLGIFSLVGIMSIALNEVISVFTGNTLYAVFTVPSNCEVVIFSMLAIMIFIFFIGYMYKFVHDSYETEFTSLSSISMNCFTSFIKVFPVMFVWGLYLGLMLFIGFVLFGTKNIEFYVYLGFLFILLPFISMVFVKFAKDFKYSKNIFNPLILAEFMRKTFVQVFLFLLQFVAIGILVSIINVFLLSISMDGHTRTEQLILLLSIICVISYVQQVLNLAYYKGLTEIIKKTGV